MPKWRPKMGLLFFCHPVEVRFICFTIFNLLHRTFSETHGIYFSSKVWDGTSIASNEWAVKWGINDVFRHLIRIIKIIFFSFAIVIAGSLALHPKGCNWKYIQIQE